MKQVNRTLTCMVTFLMVAALILDSKTAVTGAQNGLTLCFRTLIPSLFPLIFFTSLLRPQLTSQKDKYGRFLCRLFRIPSGSQSLLLTGLLGGYPVGAHSIGQAHQEGQLSDRTAGRMLVFCNASGPAFIFGVGCSLFQNPWVPWVLWFIHILSCMLTAQLLCPRNCEIGGCQTPSSVSIPEALRRSIRSMAEICGWVILLRVLINILDKWCFWFLSEVPRTICIGMLELSNGCLSLEGIQSQGLCFVLYAAFIGFGGFCVALQTFSAARTVRKDVYFPGKLLQCSISILLAGLLHPFLFIADPRIPMLMAAAVLLLPICMLWIKKTENKAGILNSVGV